MTPEERALEIITGNELLRKNTPQVRGAIRDALVQIATEQKAEDNKDRVVRMLKQTVKHGKEKDALLEKVCDVLRKTGYFETEEGISAEALETQFRQTVLEENDKLQKNKKL